MTKSGIHVHSLTNKQKKTQQQLHLKVLRAIESKQKVEEGKTLERREILEQWEILLTSFPLEGTFQFAWHRGERAQAESRDSLSWEIKAWSSGLEIKGKNPWKEGPAKSVCKFSSSFCLYPKLRMYLSIFSFVKKREILLM